MINLHLSFRSIAAARAVDPRIDVAAVHAAVEVAVAECLREVAGWDRAAIQARARAIERRDPSAA